MALCNLLSYSVPLLTRLFCPDLVGEICRTKKHCIKDHASEKIEVPHHVHFFRMANSFLVLLFIDCQLSKVYLPTMILKHAGLVQKKFYQYSGFLMYHHPA